MAGKVWFATFTRIPRREESWLGSSSTPTSEHVEMTKAFKRKRERERERGKEQRERSVFTLGKSTSKKWREFARKKGGTKVEKCYEISSNLANLIRNLIPNLICCPSSPSQSSSELPFTEEEEEEEEERKDINNGWSVNEE